jgi:hypothetical protein
MTHQHTMQFLDSLHNWNEIYIYPWAGCFANPSVYDFIDVKQ